MITWKKYFIYQADYQHWANEVLFASLDQLDDAMRNSTQGLFFDSIHKTMDHILLATRIWAARLKQEELAVAYNAVLYPDWKELKNALRHEFRGLQHWLDTQPEAFFESEIHYQNSKKQAQSSWARDALTQVMLHAVHHRGQISAVATRLGAPVPEMDYIYYRREMEKHMQHIKGE